MWMYRTHLFFLVFGILAGLLELGSRWMPNSANSEARSVAGQFGPDSQAPAEVIGNKDGAKFSRRISEPIVIEPLSFDRN